MDIERLKDARHTAGYTTVSKLTEMDWTELREISKELIDEAIARQSVKSEEVQEAIEWLTNTGHSNQYMSGNWTAPMKNHINRAIQDTIYTALQN